MYNLFYKHEHKHKPLTKGHDPSEQTEFSLVNVKECFAKDKP